MTTPNLSLYEYPSGSLTPSTPYNNAMQAIDALMHMLVQSVSTTAPPTTVAGDVGKRWIIPSGATGDWSGKTGQVALCTAATVWRYFTPKQGWIAKLTSGEVYIYSGSAWGVLARQVVTALTNSAGTVTANCLNRSVNHFTITLAANVTTLTLTNLAGSGYITEVEIQITQNGTGGFTFALPASFKPLGGSDTAIAAAANAVTVLRAKTFDNGTTWRYVMQESA